MIRSQSQKYYEILAFVAIFFFLATSWLYSRSGLVFNSPDENMTYFFANQYATQGTLKVKLDFDFLSSPIVHPRSSLALNGYLVPVGFLGIFVFLGSTAKLLGTWAMFYVIPLIASVTPLFFYSLLRHFWDSKSLFGPVCFFFFIRLLFIIQPGAFCLMCCF